MRAPFGLSITGVVFLGVGIGAIIAGFLGSGIDSWLAALAGGALVFMIVAIALDERRARR